MNLAANLASPPSYCEIPVKRSTNPIRRRVPTQPAFDRINTYCIYYPHQDLTRKERNHCLLHVEELETANVSNPYIHQRNWTRNNRVIRWDQKKGPANYPLFWSWLWSPGSPRLRANQNDYIRGEKGFFSQSPLIDYNPWLRIVREGFLDVQGKFPTWWGMSLLNFPLQQGYNTHLVRGVND